ncbi:HipA family kinase [Faecalibacter rhinopitheci]|uniref:Aminotransferase class I and II n=1 Tax=Faecalibacter rhinopitheci TaxID=2779678 RepID=A0A8J7K3J4_9FLAO|nr:HipA family kinase [Faecalibacter rhinopitheci]MBF0596254.1 aminotransferase class I and II [Faecalibacter rhinopitheci]
MENIDLRTVTVERYLQPLREGGSLPALADADDGYKYVLKFKGAGHGSRMLISELLGGEIARKLGFKVPELVFALLDVDFGRTEADEEIQDLLKFSEGTNLALHFLSGSINYDPAVMPINELLSSQIIWLDAFITNVDRTYRNTNMLMWNKELWLIDHGAAYYFHHSWDNWETSAKTKFPQIKDHVLLKNAIQLEKVDLEFKALLTDEFIDNLVDKIPDEWLETEAYKMNENEMREVYKSFIKIRKEHTINFINEANDARKNLV